MKLNELYDNADYKNEFGMLFNDNCMNLMIKMLNSTERERERELI